MTARSMVFLLLVFLLVLGMIKRAKASDHEECVDFFTSMPKGAISLLPNIPTYAGGTSLNTSAIPAYCTCAVLIYDNKLKMDEINTLKCQALSGLFELSPM